MPLLLVWWTVAAIVVAASPVRLWLDYRHRGKTEDSLLIQVGLMWDAYVFSTEVPVISSGSRGVALETSSKRWFRLPRPSLAQVGAGMRSVSLLRRPLKRFAALSRRFISVRRFVWHTEVGLADSAAVAQLSGVLWAVKGVAAGMAQQFLPLTAPPVLRVKPQFGRNHFRTVFSCILEFPLGYIIIAGLFAVYMLVRVKIARRGEGNVRTSNPGANENSHGKHQRNG